MAWWAWLLIAWGILAVVAALAWGRALAHADRRDRERQARESTHTRKAPPAA